MKASNISDIIAKKKTYHGIRVRGVTYKYYE